MYSMIDHLLLKFFTNLYHFIPQMLEDGTLRAAAPECRYGPGWIYWNGHCYQFTSYHEDFLKAEEICNEQNAYLADILNQAEGDWIKSVLLLINPKGKLI